MMELICAYTFLLFSVVSATPHGYGTKGGASAKAEAIATAGAYDGVRGLPLSIPSGPGFSGSFSKSSSSSFSSASSSASSSSSSFSYGGSSSSGLHGFEANSGAKASGFGAENSFAGSNGQAGAKGHTGPHGLAGANAFAGSRAQAGANSLAGSHSLAGTNGLAGSNSLAGANGFAEGNGLVGGISECGSGACSNDKGYEVPNHGSGGVATGYENTGSTAAATSNAVAGSYGYTNVGDKTCVGSDCSHSSSRCEDSDCLNIDQHNKCTSDQCRFDSLKKNQDCSSGKCDSSQSTSPENQPQTQCTSGQCGQDAQTNLPISTTYGSNDIPAKKYDVTLKPDSKAHYNHNVFTGYNGASTNSKSQSSDGIDSFHHSGNVDAYNQLHGGSAATTSSPGNGLSIGHTKPATFLTTPKEVAPCYSPSCNTHFGESAGKPTSYNVPLHTSIDIPKQKPTCNNGNCGNDHFNNQYPTLSIGSLPTGPAGSIGCTSPNCAEQPSLSTTSDCKSPHCAPNYSSGPQGSGSGSIYPAGLPSTISTPHSPSYVSPEQPSYGHFKPGCKNPDCTEYTPGYISAGSNAGAHSQSGILPTGSSPVIPSYSTPILIPSSPTTGYSPSTPNNAVNYGVVGGTTAVTTGHYQPARGFGGPSGILKPNEFSLPTNTHVPLSHTGPSITINPGVGASPSAEEIPPYTGGFGGPQGVLKPNEFGTKQPSTTYNTASSGSPPRHDIPTYTSGFGAPSGLLKPNEISSSANAGASANSNGGSHHTTTPVQKVPIPHGSHVPPSGNLKPGDTNVGIPAAYPATPVVLQPIPVIYPTHQVLPVHAPGLVAPTGSVQPNAYYSTNPTASSIIASGNIDSHGHHGHTQLPSGESNLYKDLPKYTGHFGGAPGVLKPNDFKDSSSTGYNKPDATSNLEPVSCLSGTCNVESSNAVAVAKADAVAYTNGFGGPPGLLKPHDGGKLDNKLLSGAQFGLHHGSTGLVESGVGSSGIVNGDKAKTLAHGTNNHSGATAQANAVAQVAAAAEATSGAYAGSSGQAGANGDVHKSGSGCGGGCGGGSYHGSGSDFGINSALSSAKAGLVNGQDSGLHGDGASAKSLASASSGTRGFGGAGGYASSSASAHASAGYATKGGYGK